MSKVATPAMADASAERNVGEHAVTTIQEEPRRANKRKQFSKPRNGKKQDTKDVPLRMMNTAILGYFQVYTSDLGALPLCTLIYQMMMNADPQTDLTLPCLTYVTLLCMRNRFNSIARFTGCISDMPEQPRLNAAVGSLRLPTCLSDYISSVGEFCLPSTLKVIPLAPRPDEYSQLEYANIEQLFEQEGRPIPDNPWRIDPEWINLYTRSISRCALTTALTTVKTGLEGDPRMMASYERNHNVYTTYSCVHSTLQETQLGACYMFRNFETVGQWPGEFPYLVIPAFMGNTIRYNEYLHPIITKSFVTLGDLLTSRLQV